MKTQLFYTICFALFLASAFGQAQLKTISVNAKSEVQHFSNTIGEAGFYTARIISPRGQVISTPIHNKKYLAGETLQFNYKPKYFQPGRYEIIISSAKGHVSKNSILVESNRLEKIREEKEKYHQKVKKPK
jgi:hypothetical protein